MLTPRPGASDYARVERAITYLMQHQDRQPSLADVAAHVGQSPSHFQRLFQRWAGVSPKRFLQLLTLEQAKQRLRASATVMSAAFDTGLSAPSRLHDLFVNLDAVTPGEYRAAGAGLTLRFGVGPTPFGPCFLAVSPRGIVAMAFVDDPAGAEPAQALAADWPRAQLCRDDQEAARWLGRVFAAQKGTGERSSSARLSLFVHATPFQLRVWRALLQIPSGCVTTYQAIAQAIGQPTAARAVGNAVAANPVAWLIPCHRVIRGAGTLSGYRWGVARKTSMLGWEAAVTDTGRS